MARSDLRSGIGGGAWALGRSTVRSLTTATAWLRPEPDLVIVGVKRGGTTSIFRDLERHPAMLPLVPSSRRLPLRENQKGVHYLDGDGRRSLAWYRGHFAGRPTRRWHRRRHGEVFTAEASPYGFFHPLAPRRAADALSETVFVVVLRDPVERTVSHWAEQTRNGVEHLSLADALAAEPDRVGDDAARLATGTIGVSRAHHQQSYAGQSEYATSLLRWYDAVGADRLVVVFTEDYVTRPDPVRSVITDRLGASPIPAGAPPEHHNAAPRPCALEPGLEARLVERFRPDVERLSGILGTRPPWPRFGGDASGPSSSQTDPIAPSTTAIATSSRPAIGPMPRR
jgi:hypothetical protein